MELWDQCMHSEYLQCHPGAKSLVGLCFFDTLKYAKLGFQLQLQLLLLYSAGNITQVSASEDYVKRGIPRIRERFSSPKPSNSCEQGKLTLKVTSATKR